MTEGYIFVILALLLVFLVLAVILVRLIIIMKNFTKYSVLSMLFVLISATPFAVAHAQYDMGYDYGGDSGYDMCYDYGGNTTS